ncbi:MAG: glycoside hydrolase family 99-like domain-containing protein [Eubacteriales bacterium]
MKAIAMYLPQFHSVKENDEWWGEGYTDWIATKNAKSLFEGHNQPVEPLNDNYYDLLEKDTLKWQAQVAKEYNIHGFCFYHYYFENGRKILEKPAENLLQWKEVEMNFCFCWANGSWTRTWYKIQNSNLENYSEEMNSKKIGDTLLEQEYGREEAWRIHFEYLLPFFCDSRYIKKEGKPLFLIYTPNDIEDLDGMMEYWDVLARQSGLLGVYLIVLNSDERKWDYANASLTLEPLYSKQKFRKNKNVKCEKGISKYSYQAIWEDIIVRKNIAGRVNYQGGFVDFDNTPRCGNQGDIMVGSNVILFEKYLRKLKGKMKASGLEYLFINAWNEWGEGMYLEPDKRNGYGFLEAVSKVVKEKVSYEDVDVVEEELCTAEPLLERYRVLNRWIFLREEGVNIAEYLLKYQYRRVAIYGYGYLGKHLVYDIKKLPIEIVYIIDKNPDKVSTEFEVKGLVDEFPIVDLIIVTPFVEHREIRKILREKVDYPIISLKELVLQVSKSKILEAK